MENINFFLKESTKFFKTIGIDTLILYVTSRCNAKCGFCFYGEELNRVPEMTLAQITKVSERLKSLNGLLIGGGEPFLRTDLFDIIEVFSKNCNIEVIQIPTNGFFTKRIVSLVKEVTTKMPWLNLSIQVSLDAVGEKHDAVRELKGCFQQAQETIAALKALRTKDTRLRILVVSVLTAETVKGCGELISYIREKVDPDYHWFEPVRDMPVLQERLHLSEDTISLLRDNLRFYLAKIKGSSSSVFASNFFNHLITKYSVNNFNIAYDNFVYKKKWPMQCCAGKKMAVLYPDGTLGACELRRENVNIKEYDFNINRALENPIFKKVNTDIKNHACDCTHGCFIPTSVRYAPAQLIKLLAPTV